MAVVSQDRFHCTEQHVIQPTHASIGIVTRVHGALVMEILFETCKTASKFIEILPRPRNSASPKNLKYIL